MVIDRKKFKRKRKKKKKSDTDHLKQVEYGINYYQFWAIRIAFTLIIIAVAFVLKNPFFAVAGLVGWQVLIHVIDYINNKIKTRKLKEALRPSIQSVATAHIYESNITKAIRNCISNIEEPAKSHFQNYLTDIDLGVSPNTALKQLRENINLEEMDIFINAIGMALQRGRQDR